MLVLILFVPEGEPSEVHKQIHESFIIAEKYIDAQAESPSPAEMKLWFKNYQGNNRYVRRLLYQRESDEGNLPRMLGAIPLGSYQLALWRGEWMEVYAPWSGKSTLCTVEQTCNSLEALWPELLVSLILGLYLLWGYNRLSMREKAHNKAL